MKTKEELLQCPRYDFEALRDIVRLLRAPDGCPWDREQTHQSIRGNFIEEVYEVCEAIDCDSAPMLREELGDVLLQVVFHAQLSQEAGDFGMEEVCDEICRKLILRHPHVFGQVKADTVDQVLDNWVAIKKKSKGIKSPADSMKRIPPQLPALMRAHKVCSKAADESLRFECTGEQICAHVKALEEGAPSQDTVGKLLFAVAGLARMKGVDPEFALKLETDRYIEQIERGNLTQKD